MVVGGQCYIFYYSTKRINQEHNQDSSAQQMSGLHLKECKVVLDNRKISLERLFRVKSASSVEKCSPMLVSLEHIVRYIRNVHHTISNVSFV